MRGEAATAPSGRRRWRRPPSGGLLAAPAYEDVVAVEAFGDGAAAMRRLPELPLAAAGAALARLLALHDRLAGARRRSAFGQPALRLAGPLTLGQRAVAGERWWHGPGQGGGIALWLAFAGRFWWPLSPLAAPGLDAFLAWRHPATSRVAWRIALRRRPGPAPRVGLSLLMRADHHDLAARFAFEAYMGVAGALSRRLRRRMLAGLARACGLAACGAPGRPSGGEGADGLILGER